MRKLLALTLFTSIIFSSCREQDEIVIPTEFGYLSMAISLTITSEEADGRTETVDTDNFSVTIFTSGGTEVMVFDPFSSAPPEVALPTGEYFVEAHSNDLVEAAFDSPYYFGRSANFTIDKEETTSVDINPELANTKVAILYSDNVVNTFDSYTGNVTVISSGTSLFYDQGETREGYFAVEPLAIAVDLSYAKLDGDIIERSFHAAIDDPQPKTLYNINVDAELVDGSIIFNIVVNESVDTVNIQLGEITSDSCDFSGYFMEVIDETDQESATWTRGVDGLIHTIEYEEDGVSISIDLTYNAQDQLTRLESDYTRADLTYDGNGRLAREDAFDYDFDLNQWMPDGIRIYEYNVHGQLVKVHFEFGGYDELLYPNTTTNNPSQELFVQASGDTTQIITYTYDDKPNPYQPLGMRFWDVLDTEAHLFSDNNVTSISDQEYDGVGNLTYLYEYHVFYTYDGYDRPTVADFTDLDDGTIQRFTYHYDDCQ